jgi:GxxExxY protein
LELIEEVTTKEILNCFFRVYNTLGSGFLEKVYENALLLELRRAGHSALSQVPIQVRYRDETVGQYFADLLVNESVIVEIKACEQLCKEHEYQLINYLRATRLPVGLLLNFGKAPQFRRKIYSPL